METPIQKAIPNTKRSQPDSTWNFQCSEVFGNPLILSNLFLHVSNPHDLKEIRLVCRLWRDVSIDHWRSTGTLCLLWRKGSYCPCKYCEKSTFPSSSVTHNFYKGAMEITEYLDLLATSKVEGTSCPYQLWRKPFTRFRLGYCSLLKQNILADEDDAELAPWDRIPRQYQRMMCGDSSLEKLWDECGLQMKYLHFDHLTVFGAKYFNAFRWILSERLPNLEELAMVIANENGFYDIERDEQGRLERYRGLSLPVMGSARKLTSVSLELCRNWSKWDLPHINEHVSMLLYHLPNVNNVKVDSRISSHFLQGLINPTSSGEVIKLTSLTLPSRKCTNSGTFRSLKEYVEVVKPPLTTLKIGIDLTWIGYGSSFHEFLKSTQNILQHLELDHHSTATRGRSLSKQLTILKSPHLTKLYLHGEAIICFRALKGLPNLQTLWVTSEHNCKYDWNDSIAVGAHDEESTGRKLLWENITMLHMDYSRFTSDSLKSFGRWMPNLKEIQLVLGKDSSRVVRDVWPELVKLTKL